MNHNKRPSGAESRAHFLDVFDAIEAAHIAVHDALQAYPPGDVLARHLETMSGQLSAMEARCALAFGEARSRA